MKKQKEIQNEIKETKIREKSVNVKYIDFVKLCAEKNLLTKTREQFRELYAMNVGIKSVDNVHNIARRSVRPEVADKLNALLGERQLSRAHYEELNAQIVAKIMRKEKPLVVA